MVVLYLQEITKKKTPGFYDTKLQAKNAGIAYAHNRLHSRSITWEEIR